jgi:ATP-dependent DNA ligase
MTIAGVPYPLPPMEATTAEVLPAGGGWQYEPKWDGFRCIAYRDGKTVRLLSKSGQPLERYFPEVVERLLKAARQRFVLDGELVVPVGKSLSFDDLLQRIHPAQSRILKLAAERPAWLVVFDLLSEGNIVLLERPLDERRTRLERFVTRRGVSGRSIVLSPASLKVADAEKWLSASGGALDGVVAKRLGFPYMSGDRSGMVKIKRHRTADCVVGGFRYGSNTKMVGSLLLGLYDRAGLLHHVGFTSSFSATRSRSISTDCRASRSPVGSAAAGYPSDWKSAARVWASPW